MSLQARLPHASERRAVALDLSRYDRAPAFTRHERAALRELCGADYLLWGDGPNRARRERQARLGRLIAPLKDAICRFDPRETQCRRYKREAAIVAVLRCCHAEQRAYWGWSEAIWKRVLGSTQAEFDAVHGENKARHLRLDMMVAAYALGCFRDVVALGRYRRSDFVLRVFGPDAVDASCTKARTTLQGWGYTWRKVVHASLLEVLLLNGSPHLEDLTNEVLDRVRARTKHCHSAIYQLGLLLAELGVTDERLPRLPPSGARWKAQFERAKDGIDPRWLAWVDRWNNTTTVEPRTRRSARPALWKAGRWLAHRHPDVAEPQDWTRDIALDFVAAVTRMRVGEYVGRDVGHRARAGDPLAPRTIEHTIIDVRRFFIDCQNWGWIPYRFDPYRVFVTPRSVRAKIAPDPRVLLDSTWAKLLWAGLNLGAEDLPGAKGGRPYHPLELHRALSAVWLFAGLRSDEIVRLRVGCVRWQQCDVRVPGSDELLPKDAVCLLDVPTHKTGRAFTKPVDPAVGNAIAAWEAIRPEQPLVVDAKTGERVPLLFCYRGKPLLSRSINQRLIPMLCRKAGVPTRDARGRITSHRARATIATQLYNARDPMSLFDLQKWLGHQLVQTTLSYVAISPTRLAKSYADAGYFARNARAIEVLVDQEAIKNGASAGGEPWRYYDLGHGCCSYDFFDKCPHRMACVRCDFYVPKDSSAAQLLSAKQSLQRMVHEIPLTDDERAAVDGDLLALDRLTERLRGVPPPSGAVRDEPPAERS